MEYNERSFEKSAPQRDDIPAKSGIAPAGSPPRPSISGGCDMKSLILLVLLSALAVSCSGSDPTAPVNSDTTRLSMFDTGRVVVYVYWADQGIPGKKVEVLELGKIKFTDENGIAAFRVPVGTFTVRVYEVERGGPALPYVDTKVTVTVGGQVRVDVSDCLPCV